LQSITGGQRMVLASKIIANVAA